MFDHAVKMSDPMKNVHNQNMAIFVSISTDLDLDIMNGAYFTYQYSPLQKLESEKLLSSLLPKSEAQLLFS